MGLPLRIVPATPEKPAGPAPTVSEETLDTEWKKEREDLLELLAQQQRLTQAGLVTSGLAHDVNNQVTVITGEVFLALRAGDPEEMRTALERIQRKCCDVTDTVKAFLSFVDRRQEAELGKFRLSDVIERTTRLMQTAVGQQGVALVSEVVEDAEVRGEARLLIQAVVNLVSNAARACAEKGGRIVLEASRPIEGTCRITVRDNGPGIAEEVRSKMFRPFVTGCAESGGTGLGLYIVRQTVLKLGGAIRLRTSGEGTIFRIDLPCLD